MDVENLAFRLPQVELHFEDSSGTLFSADLLELELGIEARVPDWSAFGLKEATDLQEWVRQRFEADLSVTQIVALIRYVRKAYTVYQKNFDDGLR